MTKETTMTTEQIISLYICGTDSKTSDVKVLWLSPTGKTALIKHKGAMDGYGVFGSWVPPWVDRVDLTKLGRTSATTHVADCGRVAGSITKARLVEFVTRALRAEILAHGTEEERAREILTPARSKGADD